MLPGSDQPAQSRHGRIARAVNRPQLQGHDPYSGLMRIANAPCSWGVLEFDGMEHSAPCAQVLDEIAATGYAGTELGDWGFMPTDPQALSTELAARALHMLGAFVPVRLA